MFVTTQTLIVEKYGTILQGKKTTEAQGTKGYVYLIYVGADMAVALREAKAEAKAARA